MVKAYLKYEPASCFGVIASPSAGVVALPSSSRATLVAAPAVDAVAIWNMRTGSLVTKLASKDTRRAGTVTALALAADGVTLAVGYSDGSLRIWSVDAAALLARNLGRQGDVEHADPEPMATFNGHRSAIGSLCFMLSPQLPGVMEGGSKTSRPDVVKRRRADATEAYAAAPTRLASGSNDGDIILWDMSAELGLFRVMAHNDAVTSVKLLDRESGPLIISASKDGLVRLYDTLSQHCIQTIVGHHAEVWTMDVDPAHQFLFTGSVDAELRVFRLCADGGSRAEHSRSNPQHMDEGESSTQDGLDADALLSEIGSVQRTSAAGRIVDMSVCYIETQAYLAICAADKSAELFRIRSLNEAEQHRKRRGQRRADKAKKAAAGDDPELGLTTEVMDSIIAKDVLLSLRAFKTPAKARSIVFPHGSNALSSSLLGDRREIPVIIQLHSNALELNTVRVSVKSKKKRKKQQYRAGPGDVAVAERTFNTNSEFVNQQDGDIGDEDKDVGAVERIAAVEQHGHRGDVRCIALSTDDKLLLSASRKSAKLWNVVTGECIRSIPTSGYSLSTCFLGANSQFAAVGSKHGSLEIVDLGSGEVIAAITEAHSDAIWSVTLDGELYESTTLVTGGADKFVRFWDLTNVYSQLAKPRELNLIRTLELPDEVLCVRVAYQRQQPVIVVSLMDSTVRAFDLVTLDPYMTFYGHKMPVLGLDISSDGLMLATGSADKSIKLWGMDFGDCRRSLRAHADSVLCVAFQPGTHYLFSGSRDGTLKYWDCDKFEYVASLEGQRGEVWFISVSSDGELVASASRDRLMRIWRRTDEQLFLEEEQDRRMDEMFESTLLDEDTKEARKARSSAVGFMVDLTKGEALSAGKRSLETVKAGERLLDALQLGEAEMLRAREDPDDPPSPMLLGMTADAFVLRALEQIKSAELEEALSLLPLDQANVFLGFCSRLLDASCFFRSRLVVELLARASLFILRIHHNQIVAGAVDRQLVSKLKDSLHVSLDDLRSRFGFNSSALSFWQAELAERHDATFRDASARAFNLHKAKENRVKRLKH
jgi:U3 small nucleolar RNA-associated protein 12